MKRASSTRRAALAALLTTIFSLSYGPAMAAGDVNPDADEILRSMSNFLGNLKTFSASLDISNEIVTQDGQKLQYNSYVNVLVQRPSHLRSVRQGRHGDQELLYDGRTLTVYAKTANAYVQKDLTGTIDDALTELEQGFWVDFPGVDLLLSDPYARLASGVTSSGYYGKDYVQGVECHHLGFRNAKVDWQLWVKVGDEPLPVKYVITTKWMTGAPQFSLQLSNWNTKPSVAAGEFSFIAPKDAKRLEQIRTDETGDLVVEQEDKR